MLERHPVRVQEHPSQPLLRQLAVPCEVAILVVSRERSAKMREMHADLMRAPRLELRLQQREWRNVLRPCSFATKNSDRLASRCLHPHTALPLARREFMQGNADGPLLVSPRSPHQD